MKAKIGDRLNPQPSVMKQSILRSIEKLNHEYTVDICFDKKGCRYSISPDTGSCDYAAISKITKELQEILEKHGVASSRLQN